MAKKITFVLPTRDEEKTIGSVIEGLREECKRNQFEIQNIIVADDSQDGTREVAKNHGASIIIGGGQGLGQAMYRGLKAAIRFETDVIVSLDTDGQVKLDELASFVNPILNNESDLVLGSRFKKLDFVGYSYPFINRSGIRILVFILRKLTRLPLTDSHGGFRAMRPDVAKELELIGTHTYVQECIIDAVDKGFRVKEISSYWHKRNFGQSRIVRSIPKYVFYTLPILILRSGQHIRILYPLGMFFIFLSFLDFGIVSYETGMNLREMFDRQSFHLILLLFMIGLNLFFFGFVIELLGNIKRKMSVKL